MIIAFDIPQTQFIRITPSQRRRIETIIADLISLIDFLDGDENLEDNCDDEDGYDREDDPTEAGIADADGLWEQVF